jgi:hypothetical protein
LLQFAGRDGHRLYRYTEQRLACVPSRIPSLTGLRSHSWSALGPLLAALRDRKVRLRRPVSELILSRRSWATKS